MGYPTQARVEVELAKLLRALGKPTRPLDLYDELADIFGLSQAERNQPRIDGQSGLEWRNRVQWARRGLVDKGVFAKRPYKPWALAEWGGDAQGT